MAKEMKNRKTADTKVVKNTERTTSSKPKKTTAVAKSTKSKSSTETTSKAKTSSVKKSSTKKSTTAKSKTVANKPTLNANMEYYDLPYTYNKTYVKILAQTPNTLFVYWDISDEDKENFIKTYGKDFFTKTRPVLIIHNITKNYSFEIEINDFANSWYFNISDPKCEYKIEIGRRFNFVKNDSNNYMHIASSNGIEAPNDHILFEKQQNIVFFKNTKTNYTYSKDIATMQFINHLGKAYRISDFYHNIYKNQDLTNISNPTSSFTNV